MSRDSWVIYGSCNEGDDVLGIFNGARPSKDEVDEIVLRLPMYVYRGVRVELAGKQVRNHRTKAGRHNARTTGTNGPGGDQEESLDG